jgi:hypothetical protein
MMRLTLAPNPIEGIEEKKILISQNRKSGKNTSENQKKNITARERR